MPPTQALINAAAGRSSHRFAVVHQLSHTLGSFNKHAAFDVCLPEAFIPPTRFDTGCLSAEYGDEFDVLSGPPSHETPQLDPSHKASAGWFGAGQYPTLSNPGTYTYTLAYTSSLRVARSRGHDDSSVFAPRKVSSGVSPRTCTRNQDRVNASIQKFKTNLAFVAIGSFNCGLGA